MKTSKQTSSVLRLEKEITVTYWNYNSKHRSTRFFLFNINFWLGERNKLNDVQVLGSMNSLMQNIIAATYKCLNRE